MDTIKDRRPKTEDRGPKTRIFPLLVAGVFFLNQINLSAAGILDYVDEPLKNYEEMMSAAQKADMYIGNLNAVIGGENDDIRDGIIGTAAEPKYRVVPIGDSGIPLQVGGDAIGNLSDGSKLIFKIILAGTETLQTNDPANDKLVAIVLPGTGTQFTDVIRHAPTGLESYTLNGDGAASQTFSDKTKLDMQANAGVRTYSLTAGDKSSQVTMRLKDGSSISMLRGAVIGRDAAGNMDAIEKRLSNLGFDATVVQNSKGTISWKKSVNRSGSGPANDVELLIGNNSIFIHEGASFTTKDGNLLSSNQGTIDINLGACAGPNDCAMELGDGTTLTLDAGSAAQKITIKHGEWDLTNFQGTIETSGKSPGMSFAGVSIMDGALSKPIKLTASSNASFTLSAKGVIDTNLSASKGALTFTLDKLSADKTFQLEEVLPDLGFGTANVTLTVKATNKSTQFTIENAKFKSSTKGELTLTLPADYAHVKKDEELENFDIVKDGLENNINDRGITFANGLRFIYDTQQSLISMTINPNGRYAVTSNPSADTELVIVANNAADSAVFVVDGAMITPKYKTGGAFGIKNDGKVDVNLSLLNETYDRRELEIAMPGSGTLSLANYTLTTSQAGTKLLVKNSKTDFTKSSGKFKIDATAGTPEFALNDEITVKALTDSGAVSFNIDSGNLDLAATADGGQTGKIQVSLANTKKAPANKTFTTTGGIQVMLNKLAEESAVSSFKLVGVVTGMELALPGSNADISPDNLTGDVTITVPETIVVDSDLRKFDLQGGQIVIKAIKAGGQASFKLLNGIFSSSSSGELEFNMTRDKSIFIDSKDGVAEDPPALPNDITITTLTDATFKLVNGNIDFSGSMENGTGNGTGDTKLVLGQGTRQLTVTLVDGSDLMVGAGKELTFAAGALNDSSTHIPGGTTRIVDSVTFINNSPVIEAVIGDNISSHPHGAIPNEWDFATRTSYPAAPVTVQVNNASEEQTFKLRSQAGVNSDDIIITVDAGQSASFKVNADGTFGGWLSGEFTATIENGKSLVIGSATDNVTLTDDGDASGSSTIIYDADGLDLSNFIGTVALNNAPASKFAFAPSSLIKALETKSGMTTSLTITNGIPSSLISGTAVTVKDGTKVTLDTGIVLSMEGVDSTDEATVDNGSITGDSGKLTVTKPASITADQAFARIGEFDLNVIGGTLSSFTVELSGEQTNDKLSSISGNVVITVRKPDFEINGANGTVNIITVGHSVILNGITFAPTQQQSLQNFSVADGKVDLRNFDGSVTFNDASAATFLLKGVDADDGQIDDIVPDIELTASSDFSVTDGKLTDYIDKNNFTLHAKDVLKLGDMTFEATGTADVSVSGPGNSYAFSETGGIKVSVANASADKTFTLNGMQFKVDATKSAVFTVTDGSLGKYESGDITVTKSVAGAITINDVHIAGDQYDQFRLSNGKFDLTVPDGITRTNTLTVTSDKSATFLLANGIELTAKPVTVMIGDPPVPVTTPSIFVVADNGQLDLAPLPLNPPMSGNFTLMLPQDLVTLGLSGLSEVTAKNGPATFDMTGNVADLKTLRGSLQVKITNDTPINLLNSVSITAPTSNATVLLANGNLDAYVSGKVQIQMAETTPDIEGTPDTTIKFDASSGFGTDSQVLYKKGAAGSFVIDNTGGSPLVNFSENGSGMFEVKLKGTVTSNIPKVVLMNAEITPIAVGRAGSEKWLAEMIIKDKKLATTSKGDLKVKITADPLSVNAFKFKLLDGTKILNGPQNSEFKISNGRYAGLISLPAELGEGSGFRIELGSIITHKIDADPDPLKGKYEVKYIQNTKLEYLNMTDLPDVLNTDTDSVPGIAILKALQDIVIDGLGLVPANGIMVFKNDNIILQSDEYYYALRVE